MKKLTHIAKIAAVVSMSFGSPSMADDFDIFDNTDRNDSYNGQPFETTFACIRDSLTNFFGSTDIQIKEGQTEFTGISQNYNAIVSFSGEKAGSEFVSIDWINVAKLSYVDENAAYTIQSNSHVNLLGIPSVIPDKPSVSFSFNDYNQDHQVDDMMSAEALDKELRFCPTNDGLVPPLS